MPDRRRQRADRARWRNGRTRPAKRRRRSPIQQSGARRPVRPAYLREDERIHIADRLREKASDPCDRRRAGPQPVHDQPGDPPQPAPSAPAASGLPAARRPGPRRRPPAPPKPGKIGQNPELRDFIQAHLDDAVEPGADLPGSAGTVPRPAGDARGPRDDLPGPLRPGPRRTAPRAGPAPCAPAAPGASRTARPSSASRASPRPWS